MISSQHLIMPIFLAFEVIGVTEKMFNFNTLGFCHIIKGYNFVFACKGFWWVELELRNKGWLTCMLINFQII